MTIRNLSPATQQSYIYAVRKFSRHSGASPDRLGIEDLRAYQLQLIAKKRSWSHINQAACACDSSLASRWASRMRSSGPSMGGSRKSCRPFWLPTRSPTSWRPLWDCATLARSAFNEVARIAAICRSVDQPILISSAFAASVAEERRRFASVGRFALRGVGKPQELYTLDTQG
jgi:Phage integrase, N-terminal SAM-like domain